MDTVLIKQNESGEFSIAVTDGKPIRVVLIEDDRCDGANIVVDEADCIAWQTVADHDPEEVKAIMDTYRPGRSEAVIISENKPVAGKPKKKQGRTLTAGRFDTREQLVERVMFMYDESNRKESDIARNCEVSTGTVDKIIAEERNKMLGKPNNK